ncbi:MAG: hypothetical protein L0K42_13100, partial [Acidipropionibacterium jensenii]|uniref:hypothetical protein n=1 Tax=Acidipropionibacterium jensenii TaxID=1749 RepID=UPI0026475D89
ILPARTYRVFGRCQAGRGTAVTRPPHKLLGERWREPLNGQSSTGTRVDSCESPVGSVGRLGGRWFDWV